MQNSRDVPSVFTFLNAAQQVAKEATVAYGWAYSSKVNMVIPHISDETMQHMHNAAVAAPGVAVSYRPIQSAEGPIAYATTITGKLQAIAQLMETWGGIVNEHLEASLAAAAWQPGDADAAREMGVSLDTATGHELG